MYDRINDLLKQPEKQRFSSCFSCMELCCMYGICKTLCWENKTNQQFVNEKYALLTMSVVNLENLYTYELIRLACIQNRYQGFLSLYV